MAILTEGDQSFFLSTKASLVDDSVDTASEWASKHIYTTPTIKWVIGNYVEADQANNNGQQFALEDIRLSKPSINHAPLNIDHDRQQVVGTMVASELVHPIKEEANPHLEVLGAVWKKYFPETLRRIEAAYESGSLYYSMEAVGESVTCVGTDAACGETFPYQGPKSETYCEHINSRASNRLINKPHFLGGALIVPPTQPGWKSAYINEMANSDNTDFDRLVEDIAEDAGISADDWHARMWELTMRRFISVS